MIKFLAELIIDLQCNIKKAINAVTTISLIPIIRTFHNQSGMILTDNANSACLEKDKTCVNTIFSMVNFHHTI